MRSNKILQPIVLLMLVAALLSLRAEAATCRSKMDDYNSKASQQMTMAKQLSATVFAPLQQKSCTAGAQTFIDSYISILKQLVSLRTNAYPCEDSTGRNQPIPGTPPEKILSEAQDLRALCQAYLNAPAKVTGQKNASGEGTCSDISGLGGPRIKCPERKPGTVPSAGQPPRPPQAKQVDQGASNAEKQRAIDDAIKQLGGAVGGIEEMKKGYPPGTEFVAKNEPGGKEIVDTSAPRPRAPPLPPALPVPTRASQVPNCMGYRFVNMDWVPGHGEPHMDTEARLAGFARNGEANVKMARDTLSGMISIPENPDEAVAICNIGTAGCDPDCAALRQAHEYFRSAQDEFAHSSGRSVSDNGTIGAYKGKDTEFRDNICTQWDARRGSQAAKAASMLARHFCTGSPGISNTCLARTPLQQAMFARAGNLFETARNIDTMKGAPNHYQEVGMTRCQAMKGAIELYDDAAAMFREAARTYASGMCGEDQKRVADTIKFRNGLAERRRKQCEPCQRDAVDLERFNKDVEMVRQKGGDASGICTAIEAANCSVPACS